MSLLSSSSQEIKPLGEGQATSGSIHRESISRALPKSREQFLTEWFRQAVLRRLSRLTEGQLRIIDHKAEHRLGNASSEHAPATLTVADSRFYRAVALGGGLGAAEAYIRGYWQSDDLTSTMCLLARNAQVLSGVERGMSRLLRPLRVGANWLRRNTLAGSKRNIAAHYDLSNEFFGLMLDPTMTYSSGVFPQPEASMQEASFEKYDRICRKLQLTSDDHLLEIGTGWGGFAEHAVKHFGCRVTTTTISEQQYRFASERIANTPGGDRITLLCDDYRDLRGSYDKLVSIEMIEAVGEKYLPLFFRQCSDLLKPHGAMLLQAITIPDDRYERYRYSIDFIQQYIFPGGFLPSMGAISRCVGSATDFRFFHAEDFSSHYARSLAHWRENFWQQIEAVKALGFDERFIRTWHYYLCYCEAGFRERQVGVSQIMLTKPACRREPILAEV